VSGKRLTALPVGDLISSRPKSVSVGQVLAGLGEPGEHVEGLGGVAQLQPVLIATEHAPVAGGMCQGAGGGGDFWIEVSGPDEVQQGIGRDQQSVGIGRFWAVDRAPDKRSKLVGRITLEVIFSGFSITAKAGRAMLNQPTIKEESWD
jgi:hypothetical protein